MGRFRRSRVTIQDVAVRAGVAKTTVSHAISGKRPVAPETRQRVFAAMQELNFRPNPIARRLAGGSGHAVALVYPLASPSLSAVELRFITSIAEVINRSPYAFLTLSSPHIEVGDVQHMILSGMIDGIILMRIDMADARVGLLRSGGVPFVLIGRTADSQGLSYVDLDGSAAIDMALDHLARLGHERIAFIHPDDTNFGFAYRLVDGYRRACERRGLEALAEPAALSDEAGYRALQMLLRRQPEITGVVVWSDVVAVGVSRAAREDNRLIPDDMSLISFDRSSQLQLASSELTIVDTRAEEVGALAARMLLDLLEGRTPERHQVLVAPSLLPGESTGPRRRANGHDAARVVTPAAPERR
jgi:DNA-binding LacI/PurR family transcriptional regulator